MCQLCGKKTATVCLNIDVNGTRCKQYICEDCAEKRKLKESPSPAAILRLVKDIQKIQEENESGLEDQNNCKCNECGMKYADFLKSNAFGCPHCYETFEEQLYPIMKIITKHDDEVENEEEIKDRSKLNINSNVLKLQVKLKKAIEEENYEEAVLLRDKINKMRIEEHIKSESKDEYENQQENLNEQE